MGKKMLVDLNRCIGCWTCSMACKTGNHLPDDEYRITVRTNGSGAGIDRPAGEYPNLKMNWMPIYQKVCTFCPERVADGKVPHCANSCPTRALAFGDEGDATSAFEQEKARCKEAHYHFFELPEYEGSRSNIVYATKH